ncbi:MAG: DUF58 domain-containing protein [Planctomycetota bacterium]
MKPTLFGVRSLVFYATVVLAYVSAPYVNLFFLLLSFLTLHWVFAFLWTARSLRGVSVHVDDLPAIPAGEEASVSARFDIQKGRLYDVNASLLLEPALGGAVGDDPAEAIGGVHVLEGRTRANLALPALRRGVYRVERAESWSTYPFGLLRKRLPLDAAPREVIVYPQARSLTDASGGSTAEEVVRDMLGACVNGEGDMQPSGLRDRREGDSLRSVHWRASARRGKLVVLEWEGGGGEGLEVVLDRRGTAEDLDEALSDLAALVQFACEGKEVLAIRSQGLSAAFGEGHEPFERALYFMASTEALPHDGPAPPSASPTVLRLPRRLNSA